MPVHVVHGYHVGGDILGGEVPEINVLYVPTWKMTG